MSNFSNSKRDGVKDGEKGRRDPVREFFDKNYKTGADIGEAIRNGKKAREELDKHPISGPIIDALVGGFDTMGKPKGYGGAYNRVKHGESPRRVFGDEIRSSSGRNDDRSYTTRDKGSYGFSSSQSETKSMPALIKWFIGLGVVGILSIGLYSHVNDTLNKKPRQETSIRERFNHELRVHRYVEKEVFPGINDYSLSYDKSQIVFSRPVEYKTKSLFPEKEQHFCIFSKNLNTNLEKIIGIPEIDERGYPDRDGFVAPLFSPDEKKIAFAVTGDHPSAIYVMNNHGTDIRRVSEWYETIVFGWASNENLFIWSYGYNEADLSDPLTYHNGESSLINIDNPNLRSAVLDFNPPKKSVYIPSGPLKVKYVSRIKSSSYVIEGNNQR